ncbi:site-specific integrase [bacterium]|nr:site-specific integrase [bacterium]
MIKEYEYKNKTHYMIQLSHVDESGKRYQPKFRFDKKRQRITSKRKAHDLEFEYLTDLKDKVQGDYTNQSFKEYHLKFIEQIRLIYKYSTVIAYDSDLKKWLSNEFLNKSISEFTKSYLYSFIFEYMPSKDATAHTQKRTLKAIRRIFESALEDGFIQRNPAVGIKIKVPPAKKAVLNTQEAAYLLKQAKELHNRFYSLWAIALLTGMRSGELAALRWTDVDEVSRVIRVCSSWTNKNGYQSTKSNKNRIVPISDDLKLLLLELKNLGPFKDTLKGLNGCSDSFDDLVLPRFQEWKHNELARVTREFCALIGINQVKFHDLRATFITNMLAQGVPAPQVMSIVGHSKMSTTDEYLRLAGVNVKGATEQLGYSLPQERLSTLKLFNN